MATHLIGNEELHPIDTSTQVYKATHEGAERLPLLNRSFISFTYDGKPIEDFNLIATIQGNRIQRPTYAQFNDLTTTYDVVDGQFFWGSHFVNNTIEFNLATDEMTEEDLNSFKKWFMPGKIKELVLAESPNRGAWARVSTTPNYALLPFGKQVVKKINGIEYETSITVYRGEISLSFVMDEPFWHSRNPLIKTWYTNKEDKFGSMTEDAEVEDKIETLSDKDFIKAIVEDNVPHISMIDENANIFLGEYKDRDNDEERIDISNEKSAYLYYYGSAPGKPVLSFTLMPAFAEDLIIFPLNSYSTSVYGWSAAPHHNFIAVGDKVFRFTAPSLYIGYNQAITIMRNFNSGESVQEARDALRDGVNNYFSRMWAIHSIEKMVNEKNGVDANGALTANFFNTFASNMRWFLTKDGKDQAIPADFLFDTKTGEAIGRIRFRADDLSLFENNPRRPIYFDREINGNYEALDEALDNELAKTAETYAVAEESVGDMLRSDYLVIENRNYPNSDGKITTNECSLVRTDYPAKYGGLHNVQILYQNLYL